MSTLINSRYQYDPTGQAQSNLIVDEPHSIPQLGARLVVAREGLFYTQDYSIRPANGGAPLVLNIDYHYVSIDAYLTAETGLETATAIEIDNNAVYGDYLLTYHAVGGVEGNSNALVQDLVEAIQLAANGTVDWTSILNIPTQFPPESHLHAVTGLTELEAVTNAISGLERALLDSRPLQGSAQQLIWQDERIMAILSNLSNRVNGLNLEVQILREDLLKAHQIRWIDSIDPALGLYIENAIVDIAILATSNLGDEFISYALTGGALPEFLDYDSTTSRITGTIPSVNYSEDFSFRIRSDDGFNAIAEYFTLRILGVYDGMFEKGDIVDCGWIDVPVNPGADDVLIEHTIDCTALTGLVYTPANWDVTNLGFTTGPATVGPSDTLFVVDVDAGVIDNNDYVNYNNTLVNCLSIGATAIAGVNEYLEVDTVDAGVIVSDIDYIDRASTIVDCLAVGVLPNPLNGEYVEPDVIDAGTLV